MDATIRASPRAVLDGWEAAGFMRGGRGYAPGASAPVGAISSGFFVQGDNDQMRFGLAAVAGATAALAVPAAAHAATIAVGGACFVSSNPIAFTGAGFTPGASVSITGGVFGTTVADPAGNISASVSAPFVSTVAPKRVAITV